jgi:DNA-binding NtrC family response regulator
MTRASILVVDDEVVARDGLELTLAAEGYTVHAAPGVAEALTILHRNPIDLVVTDLRMPGAGGEELLAQVRKGWSGLDVIVVTGFATLDSAIAVMKLGAFDYLTKPFNLDNVRQVVRRALEKRRLVEENLELKGQLSKLGGLEQMVGDAPPMRAVFDLIRQVAPSAATVLITGESGAGKELVSQAIHYSSVRAGKPFVSLNCAALSESLLENELFGHEKGAFTDARDQRAGLFEASNGGTIFLDEIAEISLGMQVKLLRVLQQKEILRVGATQPIPVDFRLLAATNKDLEAAVAAGQFRSDLYYRLNVINIQVPALRERREDIPLLATHFFRRFRAQEGKRINGISPEAMEILKAHSWPGNVRELANVMERAVILSRSEFLLPADFPQTLVESRADGEKLESLEEHEKQYILKVFAQLDRNATHTAKILGMDRTTLWRKLKKYGVKDDKS